MKNKDNELLSVCCGAKNVDAAFGESTMDGETIYTGICGHCYDYTTFEPEPEPEPKKG